MDFYDALKERDKAVLKLMRNLNVQVEKSSEIISVSYEARSAQMAQTVVNTLIGLYMEKHISVYRPKGSYEFFDNQTSFLSECIAAWEDSLRKVKNSTGYASIREQRTVLIKRIGDIQQEIEQNSVLMASARSKIHSLESVLSDLPAMIPTEKVTGNEYMRSDLYRLQLKELELLSQFSEDATPVREAQRQIAEAHSRLEENPQINMGINTNRQVMELSLMTEKAALSSARSKDQALQALLAEVNEKLRILNDSEAVISNIERNLEIKENTFRKYSDNFEQARIDEALRLQQISSIGVVQEATFPMRPVRPRKKVNLAMGFFMGIFGGVGLASFAEYFDHSIKSQEDVEKKLGLRTFVTIPERSQ